MTVLFGTLGFHPRKLLGALRLDADPQGRKPRLTDAGRIMLSAESTLTSKNEK